MGIRALLFLFVLSMPALAGAGVNPKNGNFYITYEDAAVESGGHKLAVNRMYNSKATEFGWFGVGWGTPYETRLTVMPDGSVIVQEQGTGQIVRYYPKGGANLDAGVEKIVDEAIRRGELTQEAAGEMRQKLAANEEMRIKKVLKYGIQATLLQSVACKCGDSSIELVNNEYRRTLPGENKEYFDMQGRLIRKEEAGYSVTINYAGERPDTISDSLGQRLAFTWNAAGRVTVATTGDGAAVVEFSYDKEENLVRANTVGGLVYWYEYDGNHNMTKITYIDHSTQVMTYDKDSHTTSVVDPAGEKTEYAYRFDPENRMHYWVTVTATDKAGESAGYEMEFLDGRDKNGVESLRYTAVTRGALKQETRWDDQGRIKQIVKPDGQYVEYSYHPEHNKISAIQTEEGKTEFQYDAAGQLIRAEKSNGLLIKLAYNKEKRVSKMVEMNKVEKTRRVLTFKYNGQGQPVEIVLRGKGKITVTYDENGEIAEAKSAQGSKMALAVIQLFQNLLSVVKEADPASD